MVVKKTGDKKMDQEVAVQAFRSRGELLGLEGV